MWNYVWNHFWAKLLTGFLSLLDWARLAISHFSKKANKRVSQNLKLLFQMDNAGLHTHNRKKPKKNMQQMSSILGIYQKLLYFAEFRVI